VYVHDNQRVAGRPVLFDMIGPALSWPAAGRRPNRRNAAALAQAIKGGHRNTELHELVAQEAREPGTGAVRPDARRRGAGVVNRNLAKLNIQRTRVVSVVNGIVANLDLQSGSYVTAGHP